MSVIVSAIAGGTSVAPLSYTPAMMEFRGTQYYEDTSITLSGNKVTQVMRFNVPSFSGASDMRPFQTDDGPSPEIRSLFFIWSNDFATVDRRQKIGWYCTDTGGTVLCFLLSNVVVTDGENHTVFAAFDGDAGTAIFIVDGVDADDTGNAERVAPITGTLAGAGGSRATLGANPDGLFIVTGQLGYAGYKDAYLTNWIDFMDSSGNPKALDESGWTEWGGQPAFWNEHGNMDNNLGSAGIMAENGIVVVGKGGN